MSGLDLNNLPRKVVAISATSVPQGWETDSHYHRSAQLLYVVRGLINCEVDGGVWIVPPQCAVWIPANVPHAMRGSGEAECFCLFVDSKAGEGPLPQSCCTLRVTPLLRELIKKASGFATLYPLDGPEGRLCLTLLDELAQAPIEGFYLPLPNDPRLRKLSDWLIENPSDKSSVGDWASRIGMSERAMSRLLNKEIGMSFGEWRRQLHVIIGLQRLTKGDSVQTVALDLGYENSSGFVTMFRKVVGKPPARYLAERADPDSLVDASPIAAISFPELQT